MPTKVEIGCGAFALVCFAGAADAWMGTGAVDLLIDLCLGDPDAAVPDVDPMPMPDGGHGTHASLFLAGGLAALGLGLSSSEIGPMLHDRQASRPDGRARRRLIAAIIYVARACQGTVPRDIAHAYFAVTGETLERGEIARAVSYMRSAKAAPLERILSKIPDEDEKRRILDAACRIWFRHGADSVNATRAMERVAAAMGLEGNDINTALDAPWSAEATRVLKNVETLARKTVSRATTEAQRITTRIRGLG
ncbi:MAG: hypothetical protein KJO67_14455 [Silicimonas sp.]|nr:hypothetical protein [Silicimonas sp.]NNL34453.1 hypothetical protein [Silicimonas sp.]